MTLHPPDGPDGGGWPTDGRVLCPRAVEFHLVASEQLTTRGSVARATNHHARSERAAPQCLLENNSPRPLPIGARCDRDYGLVPTFKVTQLLRLSKQAPCELIARRARTFLPRAAGWWWCELVCGALRLHWGRVWFGALGCSNVHHSALAVVSSREHLRTERERDNRGRSSSVSSRGWSSRPKSWAGHVCFAARGPSSRIAHDGIGLIRVGGALYRPTYVIQSGEDVKTHDPLRE